MAEKKESHPGQEAPAPEVEQQYYGSMESVTPNETPGIVVTGAEQFGGKQGFISADQAEAAGIAVTGKDAAEAEAEEEPKKVAAKKSATAQKARR